MTIDDLSPKPGERVFICGNSGSGKSTLAEYMAVKMATRQPLVIIDPKGEITRFKSVETVIHSPREVRDARVIRYVPSLDSDVGEEVNTILRSCYNAGNVAVWVDELYAICDGMTTQQMTGLRAVLTRGRSRNVTFLGLAQRPAWIPLFCISETNKQFTFCLPMQEDRDRMAKITGSEQLFTQLPKYQFWYTETNEPGEALGPMRLEL